MYYTVLLCIYIRTYNIGETDLRADSSVRDNWSIAINITPLSRRTQSRTRKHTICCT